MRRAGRRGRVDHGEVEAVRKARGDGDEPVSLAVLDRPGVGPAHDALENGVAETLDLRTQQDVCGGVPGRNDVLGNQDGRVRGANGVEGAEERGGPSCSSALWPCFAFPATEKPEHGMEKERTSTLVKNLASISSARPISAVVASVIAWLLP